MATTRRRLDTELVRRKLSASIAAAQELISGGRVQVGGALVGKSSRMVSEAEAVVVSDDAPSYASRGGHKLVAALAQFGIAPAGKVAVDVGASTGGFTDCLLQGGAKQVIAIDVGHGQLLTRLVNDVRVVVKDRCNVRSLTHGDLAHGDLAHGDLAAAGLAGSVELLTADLSFVSLRTVMPNLAELAPAPAGRAPAERAPSGTAPAGPAQPDLVLLVKPQFEVSRREADRARGVITNPALWRQAIDGVAQAARSNGLEPQAEFESPLRGAAGNTEFFLHLRHRSASPIQPTSASPTQPTSTGTTP